MVWRILFIVSLLVVTAAVVARGWFGKRVLARHGGVSCKTDVPRWCAALGEEAKLPDGRTTAEAYGRALRLAAIERWQRDDPRSAGAREGARRFGLGVPPLTLLVVFYAALVAKIPVTTGISIVVGATALAVVSCLLSVGPELRIVAAAVRDVRRRHVFARKEEENATAHCAIAAVWMEVLPPILRWF